MNSSENIRMAMVRWLDYHPSATLSLVDLSIAMEKSVKRHGAVLAPFYHEMASHIEAQDKLLAEFKSNHLVVTNSMISAAIGRAEELGFSMEDGQANSIILAALSQKDTP